MLKVFKYAVEHPGTFEIKMPESSTVISIVDKCDGTFIYALVNPSNKLVTRKFILVGTGWNIEDNTHCSISETSLRYIGNVIFAEYEIYHLFEIV